MVEINFDKAENFKNNLSNYRIYMAVMKGFKSLKFFILRYLPGTTSVRKNQSLLKSWTEKQNSRWNDSQRVLLSLNQTNIVMSTLYPIAINP